MRWQDPRAAQRTAWLFIAIFLAGAGGCGNTATVAGKVTYQGRPVIHGSVIFLSADKTARSAAIQPDGSYTVKSVPAGKVAIGVISRDPSKGRSVLRGGKTELSNKTAAGSQPGEPGRVCHPEEPACGSRCQESLKTRNIPVLDASLPRAVSATTLC